MQKHEFALFVKGLNSQLQPHFVGDRLIITDNDAVLRITSVLRMSVGDSLVVFDETVQLLTRIVSLGKKHSVELLIQKITNHTPLKPYITAMVPVLKRDETDEMVYGLVEVGVNSIQLIKTDRVQRAWGGEKEMARLQRVLISAAEQSKHFSLPLLHEPCALVQAMQQIKTPLLVGDPAGKSCYHVLSTMQNSVDAHYTLLVGPEGDFSVKEKQLLDDHGAQFVRLTPTILRASHAAIIFSALIRTFYN